MIPESLLILGRQHSGEVTAFTAVEDGEGTATVVGLLGKKGQGKMLGRGRARVEWFSASRPATDHRASVIIQNSKWISGVDQKVVVHTCEVGKEFKEDSDFLTPIKIYFGRPQDLTYYLKT